MRTVMACSLVSKKGKIGATLGVHKWTNEAEGGGGGGGAKHMRTVMECYLVRIKVKKRGNVECITGSGR